MAAAILDRSCDQEEDEEVSHDLVTKEQQYLKWGTKVKGANKRLDCINEAKVREGDKLQKVNRGRGTEPGQKWAKTKRQTFSIITLYYHVKFHDDTIRESMCSLLKDKHLGKS